MNQNPFENIFNHRPGGMNQGPNGMNQRPGGMNQGPERFDSNGNPVRKKLPTKGLKLLLLLLLLAFTGLNSYYMLDEENYAVVVTLGSAQSVSEAGLHFKIPLSSMSVLCLRELRECLSDTAWIRENRSTKNR